VILTTSLFLRGRETAKRLLTQAPRISRFRRENPQNSRFAEQNCAAQGIEAEIPQKTRSGFEELERKARFFDA
jgi:hypothetical protein